MSKLSSKPVLKKILIAILVFVIVSVGVVWFVFTDTYSDTAKEKSAFTVSVASLIKEFEEDLAVANNKYTEQVITVNGRVGEIENADATINIKMIDTTSGSYAIFTFQAKDMDKVKQVKEGDSLSIKGSCSGGAYSDILETHFINFKRCAIN